MWGLYRGENPPDPTSDPHVNATDMFYCKPGSYVPSMPGNDFPKVCELSQEYDGMYQSYGQLIGMRNGYAERTLPFYLKLYGLFRQAHHPGQLSHLYEAQAMAHFVYQSLVYALKDIKGALGTPAVLDGFKKPEKVMLPEEPLSEGKCAGYATRPNAQAQMCLSSFLQLEHWEYSLMPIDFPQSTPSWDSSPAAKNVWFWSSAAYGPPNEPTGPQKTTAKLGVSRLGPHGIDIKAYWGFMRTDAPTGANPVISFKFTAKEASPAVLVCQSPFPSYKPDDGFQTPFEYQLDKGGPWRRLEDVPKILEGASRRHTNGKMCAATHGGVAAGDHTISLRVAANAPAGNFQIGFIIVT